MARDRADRTRRRFVYGGLALAGLALLSGCGLGSFPRTEPKRAARVGFLDSTSPQLTAPNLDAFRQGMRAQGYEEGRDYVLESRHSEGREELLPGLAAELLGLPVDVLLATTRIAIVAARNATATIPIVMTNIGSDPVALGLVESLARPGGNVTGTANLGVLLTGKRVELLKRTLPALARLATFQGADPGNADDVAGAQAAASTLGIQLNVLPVRSANDLDAAFDAAVRARAEALLVFGSTLFQLNRIRIIEFAARHRLPAIYAQRGWAEVGGLMAYGANQPASHRDAAAFVGKILTTAPRHAPEGTMTGHRMATDEAIRWEAVGQRRPCPVCGATSGCGVAEDGRLVVCRATVSGLPVRGGGWLHVLPAAGPVPPRGW
jgi:putative ABC transport system substrate-binding protein